jgi:hypothetical protein
MPSKEPEYLAAVSRRAATDVRIHQQTFVDSESRAPIAAPARVVDGVASKILEDGALRQTWLRTGVSPLMAAICRNHAAGARRRTRC